MDSKSNDVGDDVSLEALRESRRMLNTLLRNLPGLMYRCRVDRDWTLEFLSSGVEELTGYTPDDLIEGGVTTYRELIHPGDRDEVWEQVQEALSRQEPFQLSYRIRTRDGEEKWVWEQGREVQASGDERRLEGVITDVTRLVAAEEEARRNEAQATALARAAARLNAKLSLDAVLQVVCEETLQATGTSAVILRLHNERTGNLNVAKTQGLPSDYGKRAQAVSRTIVDALTAGQQIAVVDNLQAIERLPDRALYEENDLQTAVVARITRNGNFVGLLTALSPGEKDTVDDESLRLLATLADYAAQAIVNAQLYEQARRRLQRLQALHAIDKAILERGGVQEALDTVLEQVTTQLEVDAASVLLLDDNQTLTFAAGRGFRTQAVEEVQLTVGGSGEGHTEVERQMTFLPDLSQADDFAQRELVDAEGFVSYVSLPLLAGDTAIGVLNIFQRRPLQPDPEWFDFARSLGLQAAIAIDSARLFRETQRLLAQTRQIVDVVPEGMVLLDSERRIILANPLGSDYLSVLANAATGDVLTRLANVPLETILDKGGADGRWHDVYLDEEQRVFEVATEPLSDDPHPGGWVLVIFEVTERRQRRERLQTQEKLATVGQLAAGIAHDFNNILAVITLQGQILKRSDMPRSSMERLELIVDQAQQAAELVGQILDFSRRSMLKREPISLASFLTRIVQLLERTLPESIRVELVYEPELKDSLLASADETRMQQVFMNLAVNARDAMAGGGVLRFSLQALTVPEGEKAPLPDMPPGHWIEIAVSDSGRGIAAQDLPHIFEPFFTTKGLGKGTGLGLAQVYGIVRQHDGYITVDSRSHHGTTFTVYLPALAPPDGERRQAQEEHIPAGEGQTILVVEDNQAVRETLCETLSLLGYSVLMANNGQEALAVVAEHDPRVSLVISDVVMPDMGGIALHKALQERYPHMQTILITGYALEEAPASQWSDVHTLEKPFTAESLAKEVRSALASD